MTEQKSISDWNEIEIYKIEFEYLKHLTTVCTGSILLIVAFLEKLFKQPEWKLFVAIALCCFVISIILCAVAQVAIIDKVSEKESFIVRKIVQDFTIDLLLSALFLYVIGCICLVFFGLKNLF